VVTSALTEKIDQLLESVHESQEALLFPSASAWDGHLRHDVFMNSWRPALSRSGIKLGAFSPHGLRHFAGTHLHVAGATIAELKEWLGDSTTAAVMRYVHTTGRTPGIADKMANQDEFLESA
jgi:integrase